MGGHGQQHCLICGGPANRRQWQRNHVGITEDNVPIDLFDYEEECGTFQIITTHSQMNATLPAGKEVFRVSGYGYGTIRDGLSCHASCYRLLYSRLGYTLLFEDVLPLLQCHGYGVGYDTSLQLGTSSLLWSEYGRVENGLDQVFAQSCPLGQRSIFHLSPYYSEAIYNYSCNIEFLYSLPC